jgi:cobalt-zinc-cadmium efflux system outer membrane protein
VLRYYATSLDHILNTCANRRRSGFLPKALSWLGSQFLLAWIFSNLCLSQTPLTWAEVRDRFVALNPTLVAGRLGLQQSRAAEITAFLRPNPQFTGTIDQLTPFESVPSPNGTLQDVYRPFGYALPLASISYLHEREHKRELRRESAQKATAIAASQLADQERTLLFNLRSAFIQTLQQKAVLALAKENLAYFDQLLRVSRDRRQLGDIAQVDLARLEVQHIQYETDLQTAIVSLRTAKIQLLALLNDRTPLEQVEIAGAFDFSDKLSSLAEFRRIALENRPDLKAAFQSMDKAKTDYALARANASTDPTFSVDFARNPPIPVYFGFSVSIPLRIFDRNQGEKMRTLLELSHSQRLHQAVEAQVFSDVDSAFVTINGNLVLLKAYKDSYLQQAMQVRDTVLYSYQNGGASLVDFILAQQDYRSVRLNYINVIGTVLAAAAQLNLAVGREVLQ